MAYPAKTVAAHCEAVVGDPSQSLPLSAMSDGVAILGITDIVLCSDMKIPALTALLFAISAAPVHSTPVCYMEWQGVQIDLSHMCGSGAQSVAPEAAAIGLPQISPRLVVNAYDFDKPSLGFLAGRRIYNESALEGPVYNFGDVDVRNVVVQITGSQEGRNDQRQRVTIPRIAANNSVDISAEFDLELETWSVEVLSYR